MNKYRIMLVVLWFLNLYDAISTLLALKTGFAREANVLMRALITASPLAFLIVKVLLGTMIVGTLWGRANKVSVKVCVVFLTILYSLLTVWNSFFWVLYFNNFFIKS